MNSRERARRTSRNASGGGGGAVLQAATPAEAVLPFGELPSPEGVLYNVMAMGPIGVLAASSSYNIKDNVESMEGGAEQTSEYRIRLPQRNGVAVNFRFAYNTTLEIQQAGGKSRHSFTKGQTKRITWDASHAEAYIEQVSPTGARRAAVESEITYKGLPLSEYPGYWGSERYGSGLGARSVGDVKQDKGAKETQGVIWLPAPLPFLPPIPILTPFALPEGGPLEMVAGGPIDAARRRR